MDCRAAGLKTMKMSHLGLITSVLEEEIKEKLCHYGLLV